MSKSTEGWKIRKSYNPNVLINNWFEEKLNYTKENYKHYSVYQTNFSPSYVPFPDVISRRKNWLRGDGVGKSFILSHHGHVYDDNLITLYDQEFNKRERKGRNILPDLRQWDSTTTSWVPEKSDFPIYDAPTNWGLLEQKKDRWNSQMRDMIKPSLLTTYTDSFVVPPINAYSRTMISKT